MSKELQDKYFDVRVRDRYLTRGDITEGDVKKFYKDLPNDEDNFELVMIEEDDIGIGEEMSEEELKSMPAITEENIDNFEFMEEADEDKDESDTTDLLTDESKE